MPKHQQHDLIFKQILTNRPFAVAFLKQYLPLDLTTAVEWDSVKLHQANVEHIRQQHKDNHKTKEQSDLAWLFNFKDHSTGAMIFHIEAQMSDDPSILLRTRHGQTALLLDWQKQHKAKTKLPLVLSVIYYVNERRFNHSLNIYDYFANPALAKKHAFKINFVDLASMPDKAIVKHDYIAGYELILKHIRRGDIDGELTQVITHMANYDQVVCQTLLKYIANHSKLDEEQFCAKIIEQAVNLGGDMRTVAEQWKDQGKQAALAECQPVIYDLQQKMADKLRVLKAKDQALHDKDQALAAESSAKIKAEIERAQLLAQLRDAGIKPKISGLTNTDD